MFARPCPQGSESQTSSCVPPFVLPRPAVTVLQVVFKALIVLHTMIRNGATDNILQYLSSSDVLKLRNVSSGQWEGEFPPLTSHPETFDLITVLQDTKHPRTCRTTPSISTLAYGHTVNSSTMPYASSPKPIATCATRLRSTMSSRRAEVVATSAARTAYPSPRPEVSNEARPLLDANFAS